MIYLQYAAFDCRRVTKQQKSLKRGWNVGGRLRGFVRVLPRCTRVGGKRGGPTIGEEKAQGKKKEEAKREARGSKSEGDGGCCRVRERGRRRETAREKREKERGGGEREMGAAGWGVKAA